MVLNIRFSITIILCSLLLTLYRGGVPTFFSSQRFRSYWFIIRVTRIISSNVVDFPYQVTLSLTQSLSPLQQFVINESSSYNKFTLIPWNVKVYVLINSVYLIITIRRRAVSSLSRIPTAYESFSLNASTLSKNSIMESSRSPSSLSTQSVKKG